MPGEVTQSEFDTWYEAALRKHGLHADRYVRDRGEVLDTHRQGVKHGFMAGEGLIERQAAARARARAMLQDPDIAWSRAHQEAALESFAGELSNPDEAEFPLQTLQQETLRLQEPWKRPEHWALPPAELRAGNEGWLSNAYLEHLRSVKSPAAKLLLTPSQFARGIAKDKRANRRDRRVLARWASRYEAFDRSARPGRYRFSPEDMEALQIEAARDAAAPGSDEHQQLSARLAQMRTDRIKQGTWNSMDGWEKFGSQGVNLLDSLLGGYLPKSTDAMAWLIDKTGAALGGDPGVGRGLEAFRGGMVPEENFALSRGLGAGLGMIRSPLAKVVPGAQAAGASTASLGQRALHQAGAFGALTAADRAADMTLGRWTGEGWQTLQDRLEAAADEYAKSTGVTDEATLEANRRRYKAGKEDFVLDALKDTLGSTLTGGVVGAARPLKEGLMAAIGRRMPLSTPGRTALMQSLMGNQFDNFLLNALPQYTSQGLQSPILAQVAFGEGQERQNALHALLAGTLSSAFGSRRPDVGTTMRQVKDRIQGEARVDHDSFQAIWERVPEKDRQLYVAEALQHATTHSDFLEQIAKRFEAPMKDFKAVLDSVRQAKADNEIAEKPVEAAEANKPVKQGMETHLGEVVDNLLRERSIPERAEVRAVDDQGEVVTGRYVGDFQMDPEARTPHSFVETTDGAGRKRFVRVAKESIEDILGVSQPENDIDARAAASRAKAEKAAAEVDFTPGPDVPARVREAVMAAEVEAPASAVGPDKPAAALPPEPARTRHLGRDVPSEQARVEQQWLEAASKTEKLENDPQAQAVGVLLMEAKMSSLGRLRGETADDQYRRLDIAFKTDEQYRQHLLNKAGGLESLLDPVSKRRMFAPKKELPRGMISFLDDGRSLISILERADVATLGHEMAHFFEHYIPQGHEALLTIKRFLGVPEGEDLTTADKEALARMLEVYDHSGQAPSKQLQAVFDEAAEWMGYVYGKVGKIPLRDTARLKEGHKFFDKVYEAADAPTAHPEDLADAIVRERQMDPDTLVSTKDKGDDAYAHDVQERLQPGVPRSHEEVMEAAERVRKEREVPLPDEPAADPQEIRQATKDARRDAAADDADPLPGSSEREMGRAAGRAKPPDVPAATWKRDKDFAHNGEYAVTVDGVEHRVYWDQSGSPKAWRLAGHRPKNAHDFSDFLGFNKEDALTRLRELGRGHNADVATREDDAVIDRDAPPEDLFDAAARGNEQADLALADRALRDIVDPPKEPKLRGVRDVAEADFDSVAKIPGFKARKVGDREVLETANGLFDVVRKDGKVTLEPSTKPVPPEAKDGVTLYAGIPFPQGLGAALANLDSTIAGATAKVTGKLTDPILDFIADGVLFNRGGLMDRVTGGTTSYLRKKFTELDWDPDLAAIQQESSGRRAQFVTESLQPMLEAMKAAGIGGKKSAAEANEAFARALDAGKDLDGSAGRAVKLARKAFNDLLDRMVDLGMADKETGQRFRDRYFPHADFAEPSERVVRKEIRRLEKLRAKQGLSAGQERLLQGHRERLKELTSPVATPLGIAKRFGEIPKNPLDARDVLGSAGRMRRRTIENLDEAVQAGLDISSNPGRTVAEAMLTEFSAVEALQTFRDFKKRLSGKKAPYGDGNLIEPPDDASSRPGYTKVPKTAAGFAGLDTFGDLAGHWVHDSVWSQLETHLHKPSDMGRIYDALHTAFKKGKTAFRPGGHVLQWIGNPLIWTMHGVPAAKFGQVYADGKALVDGRDIGKSFEVDGQVVPITRELMWEKGILTSDSAAQPEVTNDGGVGGGIRDRLRRGESAPVSIVEGVLDTAEKFIPGAKALSKAYGLPDQYSRAGLYVHFREQGMSHQAARDKVRKMYDMSNVPPGVKALARHWSFFRFSYTMLRNTKEMMKHTPWAAAKALGFFALMQRAHRAMTGLSQEQYDEALYGAIPGDDVGQFLKRMTALPWVNEDGRPGFWTIWSMFPQQTLMQGFMPTPAEERGGGRLRTIALSLLGGQSVVMKPIMEVVMDEDIWSGQKRLLRNRYGVTGEGGKSEWALGALKHLGRNWMPSILSDSANAMDATGAFPQGMSLQRPNASGRFESAADAGAAALGFRVRRPDEQRADIVRASERLEQDPRVYFDTEGPKVRTDVVNPKEVKGAWKAIQDRDTELVQASALRATAWLEKGVLEEAIKEIRTRTRLKEMRKALTPEQRVRLDALSAKHGIMPRLKR